MARNFTGGTQWFRRDSAVLDAHPLTLAAWFNSANAAHNGTILSLSSTSTSGSFWRIAAFGGVTGDPVRAQHGADTGSAAQADTSTGFTQDTWHHACGVFTSATSRAAYIDGGSKVTNTTTTDATISVNRTHIASFIARTESTETTTQAMNGSIAEAAIWNVALTDAEVATLAKGYSPLLVRPQNLVFYCPLFARATDEEDWSSSVSLVNVGGSTSIQHPSRIIYPARTSIFLPLSGGSEFTQAVSGSTTPTGALVRSVKKNVAGSTTGAGALTKKISVSTSGSITGAGALTTSIEGSQDNTGSITPTGALIKTISKNLGGSIASTGIVSKKTSKGLEGSVTPEGDEAGSAQRSQSVSGSITPTGALTASEPFTPAPADGGELLLLRGSGIAERAARTRGRFGR